MTTNEHPKVELTENDGRGIPGLIHMTVSGIDVTVERKAIKNLHLSVCPPDGRVRVAVPLMVSNNAVRVAVASRLPWIHRQRATYADQARESPREMVTGESHYYLGRRYKLDVVVAATNTPLSNSQVVVRSSIITMIVPPNTTMAQRHAVLDRWYRARLRELVPPLLAKWQDKLGVAAEHWGLKRMKTKWGSCKPTERRVWLNTELVKKPLSAIEYVVAHELAHIREASHDAAFRDLMDQHMPAWRRCRDALNSSTLGPASWALV